jgi:N utilization substance protein B
MTSSLTGYGLRRRSREMALQLLFQNEFATQADQGKSAPSGSHTVSVSPQDLLRRFVQDFGIEAEVAEYGSRIYLGVADQLKKIDAIIQSRSAHWKTTRMGLVDLSIMRVAVFEMKLMDPAIPPSVAINEAVEIAKRYGSTDSGSFVNGILDQVARDL